LNHAATLAMSTGVTELSNTPSASLQMKKGAKRDVAE